MAHTEDTVLLYGDFDEKKTFFRISTIMQWKGKLKPYVLHWSAPFITVIIFGAGPPFRGVAKRFCAVHARTSNIVKKDGMGGETSG